MQVKMKINRFIKGSDRGTVTWMAPRSKSTSEPSADAASPFFSTEFAQVPAFGPGSGFDGTPIAQTPPPAPSTPTPPIAVPTWPAEQTADGVVSAPDLPVGGIFAPTYAPAVAGVMPQEPAEAAETFVPTFAVPEPPAAQVPAVAPAPVAPAVPPVVAAVAPVVAPVQAAVVPAVESPVPAFAPSQVPAPGLVLPPDGPAPTPAHAPLGRESMVATEALAATAKRDANLADSAQAVVDGLKAIAHSPEAVAGLFALDRAVNQLRRGANARALLAGQQLPEPEAGPLRLADVARLAGAASTQTQPFLIELSCDPTVETSTAGSLIHLIAEIVDADHVDGPVEVAGSMSNDGYNLTVQQPGTPASQDDIDAANAVLHNDGLSDLDESSFGLYVAGLIASNAGLDVTVSGGIDPTGRPTGRMTRIRIPAGRLIDPDSQEPATPPPTPPAFEPVTVSGPVTVAIDVNPTPGQGIAVAGPVLTPFVPDMAPMAEPVKAPVEAPPVLAAPPEPTVAPQATPDWLSQAAPVMSFSSTPPAVEAPPTFAVPTPEQPQSFGQPAQPSAPAKPSRPEATEPAPFAPFDTPAADSPDLRGQALAELSNLAGRRVAGPRQAGSRGEAAAARADRESEHLRKLLTSMTGAADAEQEAEQP